MASYEKIDVATLTKESIKALKLENLIGDAVARKDKAALEFLKDAQTRKRSDGKPLSIITYRKEYLEKYCGYTLAPKKPKTKMDKVAALFDAAFAEIDNKK